MIYIGTFQKASTVEQSRYQIDITRIGFLFYYILSSDIYFASSFVVRL